MDIAMHLPYQRDPAIIALKEKAKEKGIPLYGTFELTSRCNLDCKMCYVHNQNSNACLQHELTTAQWKGLMDSAYDAGMMFALITGGECLLRKDFRELYLHMYNKGVIVSVNTNGTLINDDYIAFFAAHKPERIQISLYGSNDNGYEKVTGHRQFQRVSAAIKGLQDAGVNIEVAITPNAYMKGDAEDIFRYLKKEKIRFQVSNTLIEARDGETNDESRLTDEDRIEMAKDKAAVFGQQLATPTCPAPKPCGDQAEQRYGMPCNAGTVRFCITWQGKMIACVSLPEISIDAMENDFRTCWQYIHDTMATVKQPIECSGCAYEKVCGICPAVKYDGLFSGHCNKAHCNYLQKKYESGLLRYTDSGIKSI